MPRPPLIDPSLINWDLPTSVLVRIWFHNKTGQIKCSQYRAKYGHPPKWDARSKNPLTTAEILAIQLEEQKAAANVAAS